MSNITEITQNSNFHKALKEKVLSAFLGLIPENVLDDYTEKEIKAFFENEQVLTVDKGFIDVKSKDVTQYGYNRETQSVKKEAFLLSCQMTPFRQLVWTELHNYIKPIIQQTLEDETSKTRKSLDEWVMNSLKPTIGLSYKINFESLSVLNSNMILGNIYQKSVKQANDNIQLVLNSLSYNNNGSNVPYYPIQVTEEMKKEL